MSLNRKTWKENTRKIITLGNARWLLFIILWSRVKKDPLFLNLTKLKVFKSIVHKRRSEGKENTCQRKVWSKKSDDWCVGSQYWEESSQQVLAKVLPKTFPKEKGTEGEREDENFGCYLYRQGQPNYPSSLRSKLSSQTMALPVLELESSSIDCYPSLVERLLDHSDIMKCLLLSRCISNLYPHLSRIE